MRRLASPAAPRAAALSSADAPAGRTGRLVALVLACATVTATTTACSSSSSAGSGGDAAPTDAPDTSPATGAFTITASASALRSQLTGGFKPAAGHVFLLTDVTLANASVSTPLPMTSVFFTVTTAAAIVVHASPMSASTDAPCRIDVAVAAGGTAKCAGLRARDDRRRDHARLRRRAGAPGVDAALGDRAAERLRDDRDVDQEHDVGLPRVRDGELQSRAKRGLERRVLARPKLPRRLHELRVPGGVRAARVQAARRRLRHVPRDEVLDRVPVRGGSMAWR